MRDAVCALARVGRGVAAVGARLADAAEVAVEPAVEVREHLLDLAIARRLVGVVEFDRDHRNALHARCEIAERARINAQTMQVQAAHLLRRRKIAVVVEHAIRRMHRDDDVGFEFLDLRGKPLVFGFAAGAFTREATFLESHAAPVVPRFLGPAGGRQVAVEIHAVGVHAGRRLVEQAVRVHHWRDAPLVVGAVLVDHVHPAEHRTDRTQFVAVGGRDQQHAARAGTRGRLDLTHDQRAAVDGLVARVGERTRHAVAGRHAIHALGERAAPFGNRVARRQARGRELHDARPARELEIRHELRLGRLFGLVRRVGGNLLIRAAVFDLRVR